MGWGNRRRQPFRDVGEDCRVYLERDHDGGGHGEGGEGQEKSFARQGKGLMLFWTPALSVWCDVPLCDRSSG